MGVENDYPVYLCARCMGRVDEVEAGGVGYCDQCQNTVLLIRIYEKEVGSGE